MNQDYIRKVAETLNGMQVSDQDIINQSTELISKRLHKEGPLPLAFLLISSDESFPMNIRIAAASLVQKEALWRWKAGGMTKILKKDTFYYDEATKSQIRDNYLEAMTRCDNSKILRLLTDGLTQILMRDRFDQWADFPQKVFESISNAKDKKTVFAMIFAFQGYINCMSNDGTADELKTAVTLIFPSLKNIVVDILQQNNHSEAMFVRSIFKTFYLVNKTDLSEYFRDSKVNSEWMEIMSQGLKYSVQGLKTASEQKLSEEEIEDSDHCKILSSITKSLRRYIFKYANSQYEDESLQPWCANWESVYCVSFFEVFLEIFKLRKPLLLPNKVIIYLIRNLQYSGMFQTIVSSKLDSYLELIRTDAIELMKFTEEDQERLEYEPNEFIRENEAQTFMHNVKHEVVNLITDVMSKYEAEKPIHKLIMEIVAENLKSDDDPITMEAVLNLAEKVHDHMVTVIKQSDIYSAGILLCAIRMFKSKHDFLKFRACKIIDKVLFPGFDVEEMLNDMSQGVIQLMQHQNLAMRAAANQTLSKLLQVPKLKEFFTPHLKVILIKYLKIVSEIESDSLMNSFQDIFGIYSLEIAPFAIDLVGSLTGIYEKMVTKEFELNEKEDDDADMAAMEIGAASIACINAIRQIFQAPLDIAIVKELYQYVERICKVAFTEKNFEYIDDCVNMLSLFIMKFKEVGFPETLWSYVSISCYLITGIEDKRTDLIPADTPEFLVEVFSHLSSTEMYGPQGFDTFTGLFRNFVFNGLEQLGNVKGFMGENMVDLLISTTEKALDYALKQKSRIDLIAQASLFLGYLVLHLGNKLTDSQFSRILTASFVAFKTKPCPAIQNVLIHNTSLAMFINTIRTLEYLNYNQYLVDFVQLWLSYHPSCHTYRIRKASFLGYLSLLSLASNQLKVVNIDLKTVIELLIHDLPENLKDQQQIMDGCLDLDEEHDHDDGELIDENNETDDPLDEEDQVKTEYPQPVTKEKNGKQIIYCHETFMHLNTIEHIPFLDQLDKINEILLFETTLQQLPTANKELWEDIQGFFTPDYQKIIESTLSELKATLAKHQSA